MAMMTSSNGTRQDVVDLLQAWTDGDRSALERLLPLVYGELRRLARRSIRRESPGHTLQTTELVHEAYLRLVDQGVTRWKDRNQFFAVSALLMRRILVDRARARLCAKRARAVSIQSLPEAALVAPQRAREVVAVDEALQRLQRIDVRKSQVVELRFFGGLSVDEVAEVLGVSPVTVMREWKTARAWLCHEIRRT